MEDLYLINATQSQKSDFFDDPPYLFHAEVLIHVRNSRLSEKINSLLENIVSLLYTSKMLVIYEHIYDENLTYELNL